MATADGHRSQRGRGAGRLVALAEEGEHTWEELAALVGAARRTRREAATLLSEALEKNPYLTLGLAAAGGYVLGGGLPRWATRWVLELAGRAGGVLVAQKVLSAVREAVGDGGDEVDSAEAFSP